MAAFAVTLWLVAASAGCRVNTSGRIANPESFEVEVEVAIQDAEANGASEAQLDLLRRAQDEGQLSVEVARFGAHAAVDCMVAAGVEAIYLEQAENSLLLLQYAAPAQPGDAEAVLVINSCYEREFAWVNALDQTQPMTTELQDAADADKMPALRGCLAENGYPVDPAASDAELKVLAMEADSETSGEVDCLTVAGLD